MSRRQPLLAGPGKQRLDPSLPLAKLWLAAGQLVIKGGH
jgi:hypothetical protein